MIQEHVKEAWEDGNPIVVSIKEGEKTRLYAVYPAEIVLESHIRKIREETPAQICLVLPFSVMKVLRLPSEENFIRAAASTYYILDKLLKEERGSFYSISISATKFSGQDKGPKAIAETVFKLSETFFEFQTSNDKVKFRDTIAEEFKTPGCVSLLFSSPQLLKSKYSIENLALALCELQKKQSVAIIAELLNKDFTLSPSTDLLIEDGERIRNLWRAFHKIRADEMKR